ncbi:MAG: ABC transporter permease [Caldilineaceae bacterium]
MAKIWAIAWKELYTTLRDRNLILIMFATPLLLSTIIGLAFGGFGSDGNNLPIRDIPIAVVNQDQGFDLQQSNLVSNTQSLDLNTITFTVGGQTLNLGNQLGQNPALSNTVAQSLTTQNQTGGFAFNYGDLLTSILLSQTISATSVISGGNNGNGLSFGTLTCPLLASTPTTTTFSGTLGDLLASQALSDTTSARAGVDTGKYAAAILIPPDFSKQLMPGVASTLTVSDAKYISSTVEVYANSGRPIEVTIVRSVVEGIVNQLLRTKVALSSIIKEAGDTLLPGVDFGQVDAAEVSGLLQSANLSQTIAPITCLFSPNAGNLTLKQQPLDRIQEGNVFAIIISQIGASQAVFFSLFTGVFGLLAIYEERKQGTLQRLLVSPTPRHQILLGLLLGNLIVIVAQLLLLLTALTLIASLVGGTPTFIWGTNLAAILVVVLGLALCVSGVGVLLVGLARSPEQVRLIAPMLNIGMGVLGGAFGLNLPASAARFSLIYWGVDAFGKLARGQSDIQPNLLFLFGLGMVLFLVGSWLFKRRVGL